jgi:DNA-directed RNA polymerase I, II, and III subunit RPABC2
MAAENVRIPIEKDDDEMVSVGDEEEQKEPEDDIEVVEGNGEDEEDGEDEEEEGADDEEEEGAEDEEEEEAKKARKALVKKPVRKAKGEIGDIVGGEGDDEDDERELMDEDYIQRVHPEAILPDSRELRAILGNPDTKRRSRPILSKYEATTIVGMRAQQIAKGSSPFIDTDEMDPIEIATKELRAKLIPVIVRRIMPDNESEYWRLSELTYYE